jgi:NDP-sugar pyrophosphorylase family protein
MSNTVAAILVGGKGTRLQSVISDLPKPLAPVAGEPFLFHVIRHLAKAGVKEIILLTGYMHDNMVEACGDGSRFGISIRYSRETEPLGTGGAVANARHLLSNYENFILLNGDTFFDASISQLIHQNMQDEIGLMGVTRIEDAARYGSLQINPTSHRIETFLEKHHSTSEFVNAGIYKLSNRILQKIPDNQFVSLEQDIFPTLIQQNETLTAVILNGNFHDIGLPESYASFGKKMEAQGEAS